MGRARLPWGQKAQQFKEIYFHSDSLIVQSNELRLNSQRVIDSRLIEQTFKVSEDGFLSVARSKQKFN